MTPPTEDPAITALNADIPKDIWDAAEAVGEAIHGRHERGWVRWPLICASGNPAREIVARAIMTEREACAAVCERQASQYPEYPEFDEAYNCTVGLAADIRAATQPHPTPPSGD